MANPLERERLKRNLSKSKMADICGVDRAAYCRYEDGTHTPSLDRADMMAKRLGNAVTRDQLLYPDDYKAPEVAAGNGALVTEG